MSQYVNHYTMKTIPFEIEEKKKGKKKKKAFLQYSDIFLSLFYWKLIPIRQLYQKKKKKREKEKLNV